MADKAVVIADMIVGGQSAGPHGFVMDFRVGGKLVEGVTIGDMGMKSVGNDLDNAWIAFEGVKLPKTALLNRYTDIDAAGKFEQNDLSLFALNCLPSTTVSLSLSPCRQVRAEGGRCAGHDHDRAAPLLR